jgi:glycosyltransferase involved in cell wall biosynthesis
LATLVSILIPAFNAERWIAESIGSAIDQTWPNKEIIVVDDGSSDNTLAVARRFESGLVKVITQENRGASAARNRALSLAQGNYIQWLDADDVLARDKISRQLSVAQAGATDMDLFSSSYGVFHHRIGKALFRRTGLWRDLSPIDWVLISFSESAWMVPAVWLVSRVLTQKAGPWDERLSLNDDGEYVTRVVLASQSVRFVQDAVCYYRSSGFNQLSRNYSDKGLKSLLLSAKLNIQHLRSYEDSERTRNANLALLQMTTHSFYPHQTELLDEIDALAMEAGGTLMPRNWSWKVHLLGMLLGWKATGSALSAFRKARLATSVKWDRLLSK